MPQAHDEHYKKAVTEFGDSQHVVSHHDIYSESDIKPVAPVVRISTEVL